MSLVGTRPILQDELQKYELHHRARIAIKPGITGMWQVSGRSDMKGFIQRYGIVNAVKIIEAVALLRDEFPDIKVKVGGANIFEGNWIKGNSYIIFRI